MSCWHLLQFKPNSHKLAVRNLARQGFETFLPLEKVTRRRTTKFHDEFRPLFPGYMFVMVDQKTTPWRKINGTLGVSRLVSFGDKPAPIPNKLIEALQKNCGSDGCIHRDNGMKAGDIVKINVGPFSDLFAKIETLRPNQRIWVLLEFMGQNIRVDLAKTQLSAI